MRSKNYLACASRCGFDWFLHPKVGGQFVSKIGKTMGITVELQNLGDAQVSREIAASIEHAFSDKSGQWPVSIAGLPEARELGLKLERPSDSKGRILAASYWRA